MLGAGIDSSSLASINATILAVFFAGVGAYVVFHFQRLHEMKLSVVEEANAINAAGPATSWTTKREVKWREGQALSPLPSAVGVLTCATTAGRPHRN